MALIYKILRAHEWDELKRLGQSQGAPIDIADGYIHFSTAHTVVETAAKYFAGVDGLKFLVYDGDDFGDDLRYETARGGVLFPHLYAPLPLDLLRKVDDLPLGNDGHNFAGLLE